MLLFHVSGWAELLAAHPGDIVTLLPGPQGAEGRGVYFSEGSPRVSAAEGCARSGSDPITLIVPAPSPQGWWRSKKSVCHKHGRPRTWHSAGREVRIAVISVDVSTRTIHGEIIT